MARPKAIEWINRLEELKGFLFNLGLDKKLSVKVALLDDGSKLQWLDGKQKG